MQFREHVPLAIITVALVAAMVMLYREVSSVKDSLKTYQTKLQNQSLFLSGMDPLQPSGLPTAMPTQSLESSGTDASDLTEGKSTGADD